MTVVLQNSRKARFSQHGNTHQYNEVDEKETNEATNATSVRGAVATATPWQTTALVKTASKNTCHFASLKIARHEQAFSRRPRVKNNAKVLSA